MEKFKSMLNNFKLKAKNYGFWLSLCSAVILILQTFNIKVNAPYVNEIANSVLGFFVILGVVSSPKEGNGYMDIAIDADKEDEIARLAEISNEKKVQK